MLTKRLKISRKSRKVARKSRKVAKKSRNVSRKSRKVVKKSRRNLRKSRRIARKSRKSRSIKKGGNNDLVVKGTTKKFSDRKKSLPTLMGNLKKNHPDIFSSNTNAAENYLAQQIPDELEIDIYKEKSKDDYYFLISPGGKYKGRLDEATDSKPDTNGNGIYKTENCTYEGNFKNGKITGKGVFFCYLDKDKKTMYKYVGKFKDGKYDGIGSFSIIEVTPSKIDEYDEYKTIKKYSSKWEQGRQIDKEHYPYQLQLQHCKVDLF